LQHLWAKIKSEAEAFNAEGAAAVSATPCGKPTNIEANEAEPKRTAKKRGREQKVIPDDASEGPVRKRRKLKNTIASKGEFFDHKS
jgi:hypothetical protein